MRFKNWRRSRALSVRIVLSMGPLRFDDDPDVFIGVERRGLFAALREAQINLTLFEVTSGRRDSSALDGIRVVPRPSFRFVSKGSDRIRGHGPPWMLRAGATARFLQGQTSELPSLSIVPADEGVCFVHIRKPERRFRPLESRRGNGSRRFLQQDSDSGRHIRNERRFPTPARLR